MSSKNYSTTYPIAIIGLGHIGKIHIQALQTFQELELIAVCDRQSEFKAMTPAGVTFYDDFQELLKDYRIETVIVATPNHTHFYIAMSAIQAGKQVIVEKPAAEGMDELLELEKVAEEKGVSIYYAFHAATAFDVTWTVHYLSDLKNRSALGNLTGFSARFYDPYIKQGDLLGEATGLQHCWLDSGINALSVIGKFINPDLLQINNVSAAIHPIVKPGILQCMAEYHFPIEGTGLTGMGIIDTNWTTGRNHKSTDLFFGETHSMIRMNHTNQTVSLHKGDGSVEQLADLSGGRERLYNHYIGVFSEYISQKRKQQNPSEKMNSRESLSLHDWLFRTEAAINRPLFRSEP